MAALVPLPDGEQVAAFLGNQDTATVAIAAEHVAVVTAMARSYTRDNGFTVDGLVAEDIAAAVVVATARLVGNPEQDRMSTAGPFSTARTPFAGWSLAETFVLNRWRKRAA